MQLNKLVTRAEELADELLFPRAVDVDLSGEIPRDQLNRIASAGIYGLIGPTEYGGAGAESAVFHAVAEAFAAGCLTTCFVWLQHQGAAKAVARSTGPVREAWARRLNSGEAKCGVAFAHLLRPGTPMIQAEPLDQGAWAITGVAPWVTGWGYIDVFHAAARHGDNIVWSLLDAQPCSTLTADRLRLAAINSSGTFRIELRDHVVAASRITSIQPYEEWAAQYPLGLRTNGALSLGIARRAAALLGPSEFDAALAMTRVALDDAAVDELPEARAQASVLATRMTTVLVAQQGGGAVVSTNHAQRLAREALFLLVQGQTAEIRAAQLRLL